MSLTLSEIQRRTLAILEARIDQVALLPRSFPKSPNSTWIQLTQQNRLNRSSVVTRLWHYGLCGLPMQAELRPAM
jgi:hypothetical protein